MAEDRCRSGPIWMCRGLGVDGYDDPRVATIGERVKHRELTNELVEHCYAAAAKMSTEEAMSRLEAQRVPCGVIMRPEELASLGATDLVAAVRLAEEPRSRADARAAALALARRGAAWI